VTSETCIVRPASPADAEAIASIWHEGWADGHLGHVPAGLARHRRLADFRMRVPARLDDTAVAAIGPEVVGFVVVRGDEIEQLYVARPARGGGAAAALLRRGEEAIARRFAVAWLAVATGNERARRFYARRGWRDAGPLDYAAEIAGGTVPVPCRRCEKQVQDIRAGGEQP
jgi:GNAT superfamily N-acetyltransferase